MDGKKTRRSLLTVMAFIAVLFVGFVVGQATIQKSTQITYSVTAEVSASMKTPLDLGSLSSPGNGSKTFSDAIVVQGFKTGYITMTFSIPQSNLTTLLNDFNKYEISVGNGGGEIAWLDLAHTSASYQLAVPQTTTYHISVTYSVKMGVNRPNDSAYLLLSIA